MKKYIYALKAYAKYKYLTVINERQVIGASVQISDWYDDGTTTVYVSFSEDPVDGLFDDYGIADDEIFYYYKDIKEVVRTAIAGHEDGWRIKEIDFYTLNP